MGATEGLKVLQLLLNAGVVNVLIAMIGAVVLAFIGFVGVVGWSIVTQVPKFNDHLGDITLCLKEAKSEFEAKRKANQEDFQVVKTDLKEIREKVIATHTIVSSPRIS
jgi:5-bromo-4-chloroindolyl phosphate hydrolysis protein